MNEAQILNYAKQKFNEMPFVGGEIQWAVALYNYLDEKTRPQQVAPVETAEPELPLEQRAEKALTPTKK